MSDINAGITRCLRKNTTPKQVEKDDPAVEEGEECPRMKSSQSESPLPQASRSISGMLPPQDVPEEPPAHSSIDIHSQQPSTDRPRQKPTNTNEKEKPFTGDEEEEIVEWKKTSSLLYKGRELKTTSIATPAIKINCSYKMDRWMT